MPPMEAMACGAALCTYDNGGCRDYALDGRDGGGGAAAGRGRAGLGAEPARGGRALRERIARQGQEFVTTQFDWERATARFEALLQSPASSGAPVAVVPAGDDLAERLLLHQPFAFSRLKTRVHPDACCAKAAISSRLFGWAIAPRPASIWAS